MAVVYSTSGGDFCILRLQEVSYLIKSTTMGSNNNQERWRKRNKQLGPCKVKLIMIGRKLECTSVCNTEYMGLSMEVHTFTQLLMTIPAVATKMLSMLLMTFQ